MFENINFAKSACVFGFLCLIACKSTVNEPSVVSSNSSSMADQEFCYLPMNVVAKFDRIVEYMAENSHTTAMYTNAGVVFDKEIPKNLQQANESASENSFELNGGVCPLQLTEVLSAVSDYVLVAMEGQNSAYALTSDSVLPAGNYVIKGRNGDFLEIKVGPGGVSVQGTSLGGRQRFELNGGMLRRDNY